MIKVNEAWRLAELIGVHNYILTHGYGGEPYPGKVKKSGEILKSQIKKILKKDINIEHLNDQEYLKSLSQDIQKILKKPFSNQDQAPFLGPIGNLYNLHRNLFLDLEDIEEVYLSDEKLKSGESYGSIKSKTCGWIAWYMINKDKKAVFIVAFNHHKQETSIKEMLEKKNKFNQEKVKRAIKSIFVSRRNWYHDDLEKLNDQLPYVPILKY